MDIKKEKIEEAIKYFEKARNCLHLASEALFEANNNAFDRTIKEITLAKGDIAASEILLKKQLKES